MIFLRYQALFAKGPFAVLPVCLASLDDGKALLVSGPLPLALEDSLLVLAGLLRGVALVLLVAAPHALGEVALVAEAGPRLEVLAALAPLDLKAGGGVRVPTLLPKYSRSPCST